MGRQSERHPRHGGDDERALCVQQTGEGELFGGEIRPVYVARRPVLQYGVSALLRGVCVRRNARRHRPCRRRRGNRPQLVPRSCGRSGLHLHLAERDDAGRDLSHQRGGHGFLHHRHARLADDLPGKLNKYLCARRHDGGRSNGGCEGKPRRCGAPAPSQGRRHHKGAHEHRGRDVRPDDDGRRQRLRHQFLHEVSKGEPCLCEVRLGI